MSNFDNDNPFGDPKDMNISSSAATSGQPNTTVQYGDLDNYNPFDSSGSIPAREQVAVLPEATTVTNPPPYSASAAQRVTTDELERRQAELDRRASELNTRENQLRDFEREAGVERANNWPPLPRFFKCKPCFYQDFEIDIPVNRRQIVKMGYYLWIAHTVVMFVNIIGTLTYFIGSSGESQAGSTFGTSILLFIIFTPVSFICWYRPLYKAFRSDSSFNFFLFFIIMGIQFIVSLIQVLGINWLSSCGIINGISMLKPAPGIGVFMLIIAICFLILTVSDIFLLIKVHRMYRGTGASFQKAKDEFSHGVVTNPGVRNFGSAAAQSALNTGSRY